MIIIPAIDIMDGKVVRLVRGEFDKETVYSHDPVEVALGWQKQGAQLIHIVDLDGARTGQPVNIDLIGKISDGLHIPIQVGGGLRTVDSLKMVFEKGISRAVLGSAALGTKEFLTEALSCYRNKIAVSIDARDGLVASDGWTAVTSIPAGEAAEQMEQTGVKTLIFTDISTDGTLSGPNLEWLSDILESVNVSVISSGGVASLEDIARLKKMSPRPPDGVIIGRALYEGRIDLKKAIKAAG